MLRVMLDHPFPFVSNLQKNLKGSHFTVSESENETTVTSNPFRSKCFSCVFKKQEVSLLSF